MTEPVADCSDGQRCALHSEPGHDVLPCSRSDLSPYIPGARPHGNLAEAVLHFELFLIERALERANGHIGSAARLLNMDRQALTYIIDGRLAFAKLRTQPKRLRSVMPVKGRKKARR